MLHSLIDSDIWDDEFRLMLDQDHFETVWDIVAKNINKYINSYLDGIVQVNSTLKPEVSIGLFIKKLIAEHAKTQDKYAELFHPDTMEEYGEDVDGFKGSALSRQCTVIQRTLSSKSEALKDWKIAYRLATPQQLYDTFYNMINFAEEYESEMAEDVIEDIDNIDDNRLEQMTKDACYLQGVIGTGILSSILNSIYPRLFPGQFKIGMFVLYILSGKNPIEMRSDSSEFLMVKDDIRSKTGTIETEHNYYYPYQTFALYALRIYRILNEEITDRFNLKFPDGYRYVLTNSFYQHVFDIHKEDIKTLLGNDDLLKFGYSI